MNNFVFCTLQMQNTKLEKHTIIENADKYYTTFYLPIEYCIKMIFIYVTQIFDEDLHLFRLFQ